MSEAERGSNVLENWYRTRITEPDTPDEVYGYWTFALGIVLGIFGLLLFVVSSRGTPTQQSAIALSAIALVLLIVGPVIRLPLEARATRVAQAGALIAFAAVIWFTFAYPGWRAQSAQIVSLYAIGLALVAVGAVLVPVFSPAREFELDADRDAERAAAAEELDEARARIEELEADNEALTDELTDRDASKATFELYEDKAGKWRWRLRHRNGNVVADGGQGYSSRQKAQQGVQSVRSNAYGAAIMHHEKPTEELDEADDDAIVPFPEGESQGTYELYEDRGGEWRWRLRHDNGNIIADSGEGYSTKSNAKRAIDRIGQTVGPAPYLKLDPTACQVYRDAAEQWRWRLVHKNGNVLADSGEGYASRSGARDAFERATAGVADADVTEVSD